MRKQLRLQRGGLFLLFIGLGAQTGVWAVVLADLVQHIHLSKSTLGFSLTLQAVVGTLSLPLAGWLVDRFHRKPLVGIALVGTGIFFIGLVFCETPLHWFGWLMAGGLLLSLFDLLANTLGSDFERQHQQSLLPLLHAGFSGGAALAAGLSGMLLEIGVPFTALCIGIGVILSLLALGSLQLPLASVVLRPNNTQSSPSTSPSSPPTSPSWTAILPIVAVPMILVGACFSIDAALEGFLSLYFREVLESGYFWGGMGLAALHGAAFLGRLLNSWLLKRWTERQVLLASGIGATVGVGVLLLAPSPQWGALGLGLVGIALSPIAPLAFSMAGRVSSQYGGRAASAVTMMGYTAFMVSPLIVGSVASAQSLNQAFGFLLLCCGVLTVMTFWKVR